jgi:NDP-sugar pyrophosphorylase family protein
MKYVHHFFIVFQLLYGVTLGASAQAPQVIHYQAVIHDGADVLSNTEIGVRTSILQDSAKGSAVYVQTDTITTSSDGLVNIVIGQSNNQTGMLSEVDWSAGPFFLKLETDPEGGDMYTDSATTQFVSVPFGFQSAESASVSIRVSASGDTLYIGSQERVINGDLTVQGLGAYRASRSESGQLAIEFYDGGGGLSDNIVRGYSVRCIKD